MATLIPIAPTFSGATLSPASAAAGGDQFLNDGRTLLYVKNGGGSSITITVDAQATPGGLTITDPTIAVAAGAERLIGPFNPIYFNDASGFVKWTYSGVTSVTVAGIQVTG